MEYLLKCYHDSRIFALTISQIPRQERRTYNWNKVVNLGCAPNAIEEGTLREIIFLANQKVIKRVTKPYLVRGSLKELSIRRGCNIFDLDFNKTVCIFVLLILFPNSFYDISWHLSFTDNIGNFEKYLWGTNVNEEILSEFNNGKKSTVKVQKSKRGDMVQDEGGKAYSSLMIWEGVLYSFTVLWPSRFLLMDWSNKCCQKCLKRSLSHNIGVGYKLYRVSGAAKQVIVDLNPIKDEKCLPEGSEKEKGNKECDKRRVKGVSP